jgi:hypothetical protein
MDWDQVAAKDGAASPQPSCALLRRQQNPKRILAQGRKPAQAHLDPAGPVDLARRAEVK